MILYLIRHGKTEANLKHLYCGSTDLPLSDVGSAELLERKSVYESKDFSGFRFISSGMKRCNETLKILFGDVDFEMNEAFREIDFGIFEMHSYDELKDDSAYQEWISGDNQANCPPGGESGNQMNERVMNAFKGLMKSKEIDNFVLVSHGGVIAAIMGEVFAKEEKNMYQWQPKPGEGYRLIFDNGNWKYEPIYGRL